MSQREVTTQSLCCSFWTTVWLPGVFCQMSPSPVGSVLPRADCTLDVSTNKPEGSQGVAIWGVWGEPSWDLRAGVSTQASKALMMQEGAGVGREDLGTRSQLAPCCPISVRNSKVPQNSHLASRWLRRHTFSRWADRTHFL